MTKFIMLSAAAALAFPAVAMADNHSQKGPRHDANGDGVVTKAEVETHLSQMFARLDADGNGAITDAEAKAARATMRAERMAKREERRGQMFDRVDTDNDGQISREEMQAMHDQRADKRAERAGKAGDHRMGRRGGHRGGGMMLNRADANKDGQVTLAEMRAQAMEHFARTDANNDGRITADERQAAHAKMKERRGERRR